MAQLYSMRRGLRGASPWALASALALMAAPTFAQDAGGPQDRGNEVDEVVITGSLIRGTPENATLPVDVIGAEELARQGSPSVVELLKSLPVSNGVLGDTNQFDARAQGSEGSGSVNLRGLGPQRTLVLLNGRRLPINPFGQGGAGVVDTNMIPVAAIGRIEVLKDGAAATYGSDAIAGVVNFITRENFDGVEVGGDYEYVDGSDGNYTLNAIFGRDFDRGNIFFGAGFQHRSELSTRDRDFALRPYLENPELGGYSGGSNPVVFQTLSGPPGTPFAGGVGLVRDPQCGLLGNFPGFSGAPGTVTQRCYGSYASFDNIVEEENRFQLFGSIDFELTEHHTFRAEAHYGESEVPEWKTSPSYLPLGSPSNSNPAVPNGNPIYGNLDGRYFVPSYHPGLQALAAANPTLVTGVGPLPTSSLITNGVVLPVGVWRPFKAGGNPLFDNEFGSSIGERSYDSYRVSSSLSGDLTDIGAPDLNYEVSVTYGQQNAFRNGYDSLTNRLALALRGFGGPNCDREPNTPGVQTGGQTVTSGNEAGLAGQNGCVYFNPFSNSIQVSKLNGNTNPQFVPGLANSRELTEWFFVKGFQDYTARMFVADAVISGETNITLPGGPVQFAVGAQYRKDFYEQQQSAVSDSAINPCVGTPDFFVTNCTGAARNGPQVFLGVGREVDLERSVYALFSEVQVPVTDDFNVQLAARYEDYGGAVGSTFDPKISARWQIVDQIALRGSAGTTFRGPPLIQLAPGNGTALEFLFGSFRAYDIGGNPNLAPESATTYSAGVILDVGGFSGSIDYFRFDFDNPIVTEPIGPIANAFFPGGSAANCTNPAFAALLARFTFNGPCAAANIGRVQTFSINGSPVKTSGVDFLGEYDFGDVFGGEFKLGATATYVLEYSVDALTVEGVVVQPAFEAVGFLNYQTTAFPLPEVKGTGFAEYERGDHNLRLTVNYIDGYTDQRINPFTLPFRDTAGNPVVVPEGKEVDSFVTVDAAYRVFLPYDVTLTASVANILDEDPPFARLDLNYDPFTADGLGRTFKVGVRKAF